MQDRQFEGFADYCYQYLLKKKAEPCIKNERKVKIQLLLYYFSSQFLILK